MTSGASDPGASLDLAEHRWRHRLLLLFAPTADDARYREQLERLEPRAADLDERDLLVVHLLAASPGDAAGRPEDPVGGAEDAARLRDAFTDAEPSDFRVVLVGKDGGGKGRWAEPVDLDAVFAMIDAMPMRRREMRERS